ncbi:MAG: hypothetical protein N2235_16595 [Fischerella sp.]|nr:hypothetical protein [Fischerella sp.]
MFDAIKPLLDSGIINEDTHKAINEAWEAKLNEAREQIRAELREEFKSRYQHDKKTMVEALDKLVTESLTAELNEFQADKRAIVEERVRARAKMVESAQKFNDFMVSKLAEEIQELRKDRKQTNEALSRLEKFVVKTLAEEIQEFAQDKQALVETKVKLVAEAKKRMSQMQESFIAKASKLVKESVSKNLEAELTQLREDIQIARENMFGRRLFEAFASEFAVTHLNENREIKKLVAKLEEQAQKLQEAQEQLAKTQKLVESKEQEVRIIKETVERKEKMTQLLKPLSAEKAAVMSALLESVQTDKLQSAFEKYLPAVLNNTVKKPATTAAILTEGRVEVTGDKTAKTPVEKDTNVVEIKRLAGLK